MIQEKQRLNDQLTLFILWGNIIFSPWEKTDQLSISATKVPSEHNWTIQIRFVVQKARAQIIPLQSIAFLKNDGIGNT